MRHTSGISRKKKTSDAGESIALFLLISKIDKSIKKCFQRIKGDIHVYKITGVGYNSLKLWKEGWPVTDEERQFLEQLYIDMFGVLSQYANSILGNIALAEEAVQETFRIACLNPDKVMNSPNPKGWLFNTLKYTIRNSQRSRDRANRLLVEYLLTHGNLTEISENQISLEVAFAGVAEREEFQLLKEYAVEGKSHSEMAQKRGITVEACKKRVQRAKKSIQKMPQ